jgi:transposase
MSRACEDKFALRHAVVRYVKTHGIHAAVRQFGCARNTVRLWFRRWEAGDDTLADRSRRPHRQPRRTQAAHEKLVIAARKQAPCFGARRLVDLFALPVGKGATHRILRDAKLVRPRPRKHRRKADLRAIKAAHPPLCRLQMDKTCLITGPKCRPRACRVFNTRSVAKPPARSFLPTPPTSRRPTPRSPRPASSLT